jgi:hypothetical protein
VRNWSNQIQAFYGAITLSPPSTVVGNALTIAAPTQSNGIMINGTDIGSMSINSASTSYRASIGFTINGTNYARVGVDGGNFLFSNSAAGDLCLASSTAGASSIRFGIGGGASQMQMAPSGAVSINAPSSAVPALTATGAAGAYAVSINGATSSTGYGLAITGNYTGSGTTNLLTVADTGNTNGVNVELVGNGATTPAKYIRVVNGSLGIVNNAYTATLLQVNDDGSVVVNGATGGDEGPGDVNANGYFVNGVNINTLSVPIGGNVALTGASGGAQGAGTINAAGLYVNGVAVGGGGTTGTFTATFTGFLSNPTPTVRYAISGSICTLIFPATTQTSNATSFTITGLPAACQPAHAQFVSLPPTAFENNGIISGGTVEASFAAASGTITLVFNGSGSGWAASGTKGTANPFSVTYSLF